MGVERESTKVGQNNEKHKDTNKDIAYQDCVYILRADCSLYHTHTNSTQDKLAAHAVRCLHAVANRLSAVFALPVFCVHNLLAIGTSLKNVTICPAVELDD
jgi:hypothetical protein